MFCWDPEAGAEVVGEVRRRFLVESLSDLSSSLSRLVPNTAGLIFYQGSPMDQKWVKALQALQVSAVFFERDYEPYARRRDRWVRKHLAAADVKVESFGGHTLFDMVDHWVPSKEPVPLTFRSMQTTMRKLGAVPRPLEAPEGPIELPKCTVNDSVLAEHSLTRDVSELHSPARPSGLLGEPQDPDSSPFAGGETEGLRIMSSRLSSRNYVAKFEKPKTDPTSFGDDSVDLLDTTGLSPYMRFGCVSARRLYHELAEVERRAKAPTQPPVSLKGQLLWREFYTTIGVAVGDAWSRIEGNQVSRKIPWRDSSDAETSRLLAAWEAGQTGYPWIDAAMRQLHEWGWMHHLARHAVACFLTRGDLWVSWEEGVAVFERKLVDADWALNAGNWMWLSASAFFHTYHRVYSPTAFPSKYAGAPDFVRRFVPELAKLPDKYIMEPWKAPPDVLSEANVRLGKTYPHPIVDHADVRSSNLDRMSKAYADPAAKAETRTSLPALGAEWTEELEHESSMYKPRRAEEIVLALPVKKKQRKA